MCPPSPQAGEVSRRPLGAGSEGVAPALCVGPLSPRGEAPSEGAGGAGARRGQRGMHRWGSQFASFPVSDIVSAIFRNVSETTNGRPSDI